ncbi:uronyl 2-sulfotransferase-like isoform X2 [Penaeus chinensis]|uniref:uronyl 2-sulfotransferase-like isoform X2 n=1 Tax=Penaeus chinensis TaxID=139456 RepID=UPI001FB5D775|nr:uronyl 2-sulfotransferase-like isoform X2 [Penaeus chinensis]
MLPRPKVFIVFVAWAAACGLMLVLWQDPSALPAHQQHLSAPTPSRARGHRIRTHVSNPLYLQVRGSDRTEKYPTYRRDAEAEVKEGDEGDGLPPETPLEDEEDEDENEGGARRGGDEYSHYAEEEGGAIAVEEEETPEDAVGDEKEEKEGEEMVEEEEEEEESEVEVMQMDEVDTGGRFNNTPDSSLLVYNRIPKCASSTMQAIFRRLSSHLGFVHISSLVYNQRLLNHGEQLELVENLTGALRAAPTHTLSYDRHLYYTNFTELGSEAPVYVNIVRDPVERFISSFYYRRSQERLNRIPVQGRTATPSPKWLNRTVEQCVLAGDNECAFRPGDEKEMMLTYFCGHHDFCRIVGHKDALQVAKQVVSQDYSVVGLVEHMEISLLLMEALVPRFMVGASQVYSSRKQKEQLMVNKNQEKPEVPVEIREKLLQRMADDFEFYNFLEQRLHQQKKAFLPDQGNE